MYKNVINSKFRFVKENIWRLWSTNADSINCVIAASTILLQDSNTALEGGVGINK